MNGLATRNRALPYALAFFGSLCIMILELVASRLVARHVGASLNVWTSVIGIMLGGICLGNVLGGRLADRADPSKVIGPLYALGSALTLGSLWLNTTGRFIAEAAALPDWLKTLLLVSIDFLVPGTVLGMIGPVVAKIAVEQARKAGSAIGDVYFLGAIGSIAGTFLAGFFLMRYASTTAIITLVAAGLALMSSFLIGDVVGLVLGLATAALLGLGSISPLVQALPIPGVRLGELVVNPIAMAGHVLALALAVMALVRLVQAKLPDEEPAEDQLVGQAPAKPKLSDLAALAFLISLGFMAFEMAAGRLVSRHLGSSIYGWTSVIGVLLGGLSLGNFIGGKLADRIEDEKRASWLFLVASALILSVILLEVAPFGLNKGQGSVLSNAITMRGFPWGVRVFFVTTVVFFLPSIALGTVSPVMAKLAVDRVKRMKRTGSAIGVVYAWGMVGSILGTFLTGFLLIDVLGTKGVLLLIATILALAATVIGTTWHAVWAGLPLGLCIIAFVPVGMLRTQGEKWGIREVAGNPDTDQDEGIAWLDESNYYYIKVENNAVAEGKKRTLVLDNLIHGYFILDHPERLDYDYEHIYALVADRVAKAKAKARLAADPKADDPTAVNTLFLGGGAYTFQRYMQYKYKGTQVEVAEIDPAVKEANHKALGLPPDDVSKIVTHIGDARQFVERNQGRKKFDIIFGDAFNDFSVPWHLTTREFNEKLSRMMGPEGVYMINIIDVFESDATADRKALAAARKEAKGEPSADLLAREKRKEMAMARDYGGFLGAWAKTASQTFPHIYVFGTDNSARYEFTWLPGAKDVEEIPKNGVDQVIVARLGNVLYFRVFDDNRNMAVDIDEAKLLEKAKGDPGFKAQLDAFRAEVEKLPADPKLAPADRERLVEVATSLTGHPYGPGGGQRETFVVVASKVPLDVDDLGSRPGDPEFFYKDRLVEPKPYSKRDMDALEIRSRGIVLTDDFAPVENLLAPVAATRGLDD